jgi:cytochrome c553
VYADSCARCHGKNGEGVAGNFPNLAHNQGIWEGAPDDVIAMILGGFRPWHPHQAAMPVFEGVLSDHQIAAVANYVRTSWGNQGRADADANAVGRLRATMDQEIALNTGTMRLRLTDASGTRAAIAINGLFDLLGDRRNCRLDTTLTVAKAPADPLHIAGTCTDDGFALTGWLTQGDATRPVRLALRDEYSPAGHLVGVVLEGPTGTAGEQLSAHIAVVTPNY